MTAESQTPDDTAGERLVWALVAAVGRHDDEACQLLEQEADEQTVRDALAFAVGGAVGALTRASTAEQPGTDQDRALAGIANAASLQALAAAATREQQ